MILVVNLPSLNSRQVRPFFEKYHLFFLQFVAIACLLPTALAQTPCSVCGENAQVGKPNAIFQYPQQPAVTCELLENAGTAGLIPMSQCSFLPQLIVDTCGCKEIQVETNSPTSNPTYSPTFKPTIIPLPDPTEQPTPTSKPTDRPTLPPTMSPTMTPTTAQPSKKPSLAPSSSPTLSPTPRKTFAPTLMLSANPSIAPTVSPSMATSSEPTLVATPTPTLEPTAVPSNVPTGLPTQAPTKTHRPSGSPSDTPTISPTISPSTSPTGLQLVQVVMFFEGGTKELSTTEKIDYNDITGTHIENELESIADEYSLTVLFVGVSVKTQEIIVPVQEDAPTESPIESRALQEQSILKVVSDASIRFQSPITDLDVSMLVGGAFNEEEERRVYLQRLRSKLGDGAYEGDSLKVEVDGFEFTEFPTEVPTEVPEVPGQLVEPPAAPDTGEINIVPIVGGVAGGIALVIGAFLIYRRRRIPKEDITFATTNESRPGERINTDILVEPQDEISTLGDPMYTGGGMMIPGLEKDETVANSHISGDYEYSKNYQARQRADTLQSSLGESKDSDLSSFAAFGRDSVFDDDVSFEQQFTEMEDRFEVVAPAGKLGMVIDTPSGGMPVVHAIKDTSILADQVMVGDRLISVDDEDTTGFTAMQVSKLISQKVHQPTRTLMFSRTKARK